MIDSNRGTLSDTKKDQIFKHKYSDTIIYSKNVSPQKTGVTNKYKKQLSTICC
jgi:hypothetical protein